MRIKRIRLFRVGIPFTLSVDHNLKKRKRTDALVAEVTTDDGAIGYGEGAPRKYVNGIGFDDIITHYTKSLSHLKDSEVLNLVDISDSSHTLGRAKFLPALTSAIELALLDLYARRNNVSVASLLGPSHQKPLIYSAVIPFMTEKNSSKIIEVVQYFQFSQIKIKVGTTRDIAQIERIKSVAPGSVDIRVDANRAWTFKEASEIIPELNDLSVSSVEEPLIVQQIDRLPELAAKIKVSLMLDESVYNLVQAKHFFQLIPNQQLLFNIKISKSTGLLGAHRLFQFAKRHHIACQLGCNVGETAILSAAGRLFAQTHPMKHLEGSFAPLFMEDDIGTKPIGFGHGGMAKALMGPGMGVEIVSQKVSRYGELIGKVEF